ncbi:hypothetical protein [Nonomuraea sp. SYSU D8015]|uniref:hypothetical protein n=1 Tax=Nonomuraea sp. SYSU D8015 TaxID=2593644 RepID=UPI001660E66E|nr:hypothetical protein [Nonomuraea sp. SYSU D8015]
MTVLRTAPLYKVTRSPIGAGISSPTRPPSTAWRRGRMDRADLVEVIALPVGEARQVSSPSSSSAGYS